MSNFGLSHPTAPWLKGFSSYFLFMRMCVFISRCVRGLLRSVRATLTWCHISRLWAFYFIYFFFYSGQFAFSSADTHNGAHFLVPRHSCALDVTVVGSAPLCPVWSRAELHLHQLWQKCAQVLNFILILYVHFPFSFSWITFPKLQIL